MPHLAFKTHAKNFGLRVRFNLGNKCMLRQQGKNTSGPACYEDKTKTLLRFNTQMYVHCCCIIKLLLAKFIRKRVILMFIECACDLNPESALWTTVLALAAFRLFLSFEEFLALYACVCVRVFLRSIYIQRFFFFFI